jgi:hypothetical protein
MSIVNIGEQEKTLSCEFVFENHIVCGQRITETRAKWTKDKYKKFLCPIHEKEISKNV